MDIASAPVPSAMDISTPVKQPTASAKTPQIHETLSVRESPGRGKSIAAAVAAHQAAAESRAAAKISGKADAARAPPQPRSSPLTCAPCSSA